MGFPPLEQTCYSCRILLHDACEETVNHLGVDGPCLCRVADHGARYTLSTDDWNDYKPLDPIPKRFGHQNNAPVTWESVVVAYGLLTQVLDAYNQSLQPSERVHVPYSIQEALVAYGGEEAAIASIVGKPTARRARCANKIEPDGRPCPGALLFYPGDPQAQCSNCGAWCGAMVADYEEPVTGDANA